MVTGGKLEHDITQLAG